MVWLFMTLAVFAGIIDGDVHFLRRWVFFELLRKGFHQEESDLSFLSGFHHLTLLSLVLAEGSAGDRDLTTARCFSHKIFFDFVPFFHKKFEELFLGRTSGFRVLVDESWLH